MGRFLILFLLASNSMAVRAYEIVITTKWDSGKSLCTPCTYASATSKVYSNQTIRLPETGNFNYSNVISSVSYETISLPSRFDKKYLPSAADIQISFEKSRMENYLVVAYSPLIFDGAEVKMVSAIKIEVQNNGPVMNSRSTSFAPNSVLNSGTWFKVGITKSGVHKLDYSFLQTMGVSMGSLNPNSINIYGNHIPKLPTLNNQYHPDDLIKNNIYIEGDGDGVFNSGDYILFYATGPDEITVGADDFFASANRIDSMSYYFIHIDSSDPPQRIGTTINSASPVTDVATTGINYFLHENDNVNLLKSGDGWLGEHFDVQLTHTFTANLESVAAGSSIEMTTAIGSAVKSGTGTFSVSVNGTQVNLITCPTLSGSYTEAKYSTTNTTFTSTSADLNFSTTFTRSSASSEAWLDYILLNYKRNLSLGSGQLFVHNFETIGAGKTTRFDISNVSSATRIWEITDPTNVNQIAASLSGSVYSFIQNTDSLRSFVAFNSSQALIPVSIGSVTNQDLHALPQADYIIVTHSSLTEQANRLADLHRSKGLSVHVVDIRQVYNEFGGGAADPVAVRWMMKMFYDRAAGDPALMPKYLCLFGDGTYDPLNRLTDNFYLVPTYNSVESGDIEYISSYTADDFFGFLDDNEGISASNLLDIGIGRIPVISLDQAQQVVDKIEHYMNFGSYLYSNANGVQCNSDGYSSTFGDWRNRVVLMADDEDFGQFVDDCEALSDTTEKYHPEMNVIKIYLDAYQQTVTSGGQRYPGAEEAINQNMNKGALIFNYVGHGGETGLSLERVVTIPMIESWTNINNLTVFISATCEFSRFDDPNRVSAGETTLITPYGGAVGLLTTTRLVQVSVNTNLVQNLYTVLFNEVNDEPLALGEILRQTKNLTAGSDNIRNFTLLGDPALKLGKPQPMIVTDSINGVSVLSATDTLKALSKITISGHVEDGAGNILTGYNGIAYPTIYDKSKLKYTLGQDPNSPVLGYMAQNNVIYKGKSSVVNGYFTCTFVVPKDIDYNYGKGKVSYYSNDANSNSYGYDTSIVVGGVDPNGVNDQTGPLVDLFMNDQNFADGGITNSTPTLIAEISDENGINTTGNGIGHDITVIIDGNTSAPIILNNFYEADLDTYQSGKVTYQFTELEEGPHDITFKVWDVNNNSSESKLEFVVVNEEELGISHVLNYPNPFTTHTEFFFEHNQCCSALEVRIDIFTVSGKLVKTIFENVNTVAYRSEGIEWDGKDEYGDELGRGVYVYRLQVTSSEGKKEEVVEKLVIF